MGFLAACPYMLKSVLGPLGGLSADFLIKYKIMSIRNVRALYYAIGMCGHSSTDTDIQSNKYPGVTGRGA